MQDKNKKLEIQICHIGKKEIYGTYNAIWNKWVSKKREREICYAGLKNGICNAR